MVIKTFKNVTKLGRIKKEINILRIVQDHLYISEFVDIIEASETRNISIVYNYYENTATYEVFSILTDRGNKLFLFKLLKSLDYAHSKGVYHADIKPLNIIVNSDISMLKLIDWGLSEFYIPGVEKTFNTVTMFYHQYYHKVFSRSRITFTQSVI